MENKEIVKLAAKACDDKRAEDITALDMNEVSLVADYFLICHANTERQVQAIARGIKEAMDEAGVAVSRIEGLEQSRWVLVDLGDVVCHVFHREERVYYNLERLWGDAERLQFDHEG
ncbi:ribosomal silencing factor RsfS [Oceanobacillus picturae]|jgi:ribosome-associated protein|uniref:Ribosomal silencing factor RsfS n=2 Tax=Oceanobacillus TaxID=182709 RepID=W9B538_9BACI|nr:MULTISPECIES: ribosome silencing factor [Oceanobacillus]AVQ99432.1 ribosome silencing factor RsfS [Oceanobacillus iheyensis]MCG3418639.1 ribosome silencing factor [Oceanobacillus jordanicus]GAQ19342.1 ribosomal silencing factor RsfS [Oceanobacillus picturae]CDO01830.1 Ribosomal silencing factor RsfS [Oceanobacillus picturae]